MNPPFSLLLNCATQTFARRLFPMGYDVVPGQPYTDAADLVKQVRATGRLEVSSDYAARTIYGDADVNQDARAWHDWVHFRYGLEFDLAGETVAAFVQLSQLVRDYGTEYEAGALLMIETLGQVLHHNTHGSFPVDQADFALGQLQAGVWLSVVRDLMDEMEEHETTDQGAMALARRDGRGLWSYILAPDPMLNVA